MSQVEIFPPTSPVPPAESDDWFTPRHVFDPLHAEFNFTLDAAGHCEAPVTKAIGRYFGLDHIDGAHRNGLTGSWAGERVWCNMPYSPGNLEAFVKKCHEEKAHAELICALLPVRTDRKWWHRYIEPFRGDDPEAVELRFICGRVSFGWPGNPEAKGGATAREPSCLVIWRNPPPVLWPPADGRVFGIQRVKP